jgi:hypothetical protein
MSMISRAGDSETEFIGFFVFFEFIGLVLV